MINLFDRAVAKKFFTAYGKEVKCAVVDSKIDLKSCNISLMALGAVFREAQKDCMIFQERRPLGHGVSAGKVAGSLVFRLCRTQTLFFDASVIENPEILKIPVNAALALGLDMVGVSFDKIDDFIIRELKYFLAKRHINQEALGICFDVLAKSKKTETP